MSHRRDEEYQHAITRQNNSKHKNQYDSRSKDLFQLEEQENIKEVKNQNAKLKKQLKESQAKRTQITKQCAQYHKKYEQLQQKNFQLLRAIKQGHQNTQGDKYRVEQLKFLNKQLSTQIQQLRNQNQDISEKLRYCNQILQRKYEQLQQKTFRRIQQTMKRIKKGMHYLQSLSPKEIQKTKEILVQNLRKASQILKGKLQQDYENQIQQLMNPIKNIQQELHQAKREISNLHHQNQKLQEQVKKHKKIQKQLLPQYKHAIQKLKKNLLQVRSQLSENEYDKGQLKKKYQDKLKDLTNKYNQLSVSYRKSKLQKKMFENKIQELEAQVEEQKERLVGQNQILKKLYSDKNENYDLNPNLGIDMSSNQISSMKNHQYDYSYEEDIYNDHKRTKNFLKKSHSSKNMSRVKEKGVNLNTQTMNFKKKLQNSRSRKVQKPDISQNQDYSNNQGYLNEQEEGGSRSMKPYGYEDQESMMSQQSLKNQICKIDEQIMMIQRNLTKQLQNYE